MKKILLLSTILFFFILPFVHWPSLKDPYELPKVLIFLIAINFLGVVTFFTDKDHTQETKSLLFPLLLIFFLIAAVSSLINGQPPSLFGQNFSYQGLIVLESYLLFFYLFSHPKSPALEKQLAQVISFGGLTVAILVLIQAFCLQVLHWPIANYLGQLFTFFGNPHFCAGFLALSFVYHANYPLSLRIKNFSWLVFLLAIYFTGSRSGILAFVSSATLSFTHQSKRLVQLIIFLTVILTVGFLIFPQRAVLTIEDRNLIWQKGLQAGLKKPLLGWGLENFNQAFQSTLKNNDDLKSLRVDKAHNQTLEVFVSSGLAGLIAYLLILIVSFRLLWQHQQNLWHKTNLIALLTFFILSQLNVLNLNEYLFFYFILANAASVQVTSQQKAGCHAGCSKNLSLGLNPTFDKD